MHDDDIKAPAPTVGAGAVGVDREVAAYTEGWIRGFAVAGALRPTHRPRRQRAHRDDAVFNGDLLLRS